MFVLPPLEVGEGILTDVHGMGGLNGDVLTHVQMQEQAVLDQY
jgi:hypothetical protein